MKHLDPYLTAEALGFTEKARTILIQLADDLVNERLLFEDWQMTDWNKCICGNMNKRGAAIKAHGGIGKEVYRSLFVGYTNAMKPIRQSWPVTQKEAGQAAYNYLTLGDPRWEEVLNGS